MESGTFRKTYHRLQQEHADRIIDIKSKAEELEKILVNYKSREMSLAMTNLEQAIMWATKAIVLHDEADQKEV
jgi:hypothetical protein